MKTNIFSKFTILFIILLTGFSLFSQRCDKKRFGVIEPLEGFDYRGQSSYGVLSPADTVRTKLVLYSKQEYHVYVEGEEYLGAIEFQILTETRKYRKVVEEVQEEEVILYKENEYGAYEVDEYGDYIEIGRETVYDTIWAKEPYIERDIIYDNMDNETGLNYWRRKIDKTKIVIVQVMVPENAPEDGCVNVYVGHRYIKKNKLKKM